MAKKVIFLAAFLIVFPFIIRADDSIIVDRVIDARTLLLKDGREVHLIGVQIPELNDLEKNRRMAEERNVNAQTVQIYGYIAKNFVRDLVEGERVILSYDDANNRVAHKDRDGKVMAYVWFNLRYKDNKQNKAIKKMFGITAEDRLLNAEIIKSGYGFTDNRAAFLYQSEFDRQEKEAKENEKGLWRSKPMTYNEIYEVGRGALSVSTTDFITQEARELGLGFAQRTFTQLMALDPNDYRAYYARSWLGVGPFYATEPDQNLQDIERVITLVPEDPKAYAHKHYLLRLAGKHAEAGDAYKLAIYFLGKKEVFVAGVTHETAKSVIEPHLESQKDPESMRGFFEDATRASLNEEHFLFFMARYKEGGVSETGKILFKQISRDSRFRGFYQRNKQLVEKSSSKEILDKTKWSVLGWQKPDEVLEDMEKIN